MKKILLTSLLFLFIGSFLQAQSVSVTFKVDMSIKAVEGSFIPGTDTVFVAGNLNGWNTSVDELTDANSDSVYEVTIDTFTVGQSLSFKYVFKSASGTTWEGDPNREYTVPEGGGTYQDYFDRDSTLQGATANVTFEVDMSVLTLEGKFTPGTDPVFIAGDFQGWNASGTPMEDPNNDTIYTVTVENLEVGSTLHFKYIYNRGTLVNWEQDPNREYVVPETGGYYKDYFDRDSVVNITGNGNILFSVDMNPFNEIGIYNPDLDSLRIYGSFNGWGSGDIPEKWKLAKNPFDPNLWELNVPFQNVDLNSVQNYKFFIELDSSKTGMWADGYERPASQGGGNRDVTFFGTEDQVDSTYFYDDIKPDYIIEEGKNLSITFNVNMAPAMDPVLQAVPFNPTTDTVYWISEMPSFVFTQGWVDTDDMKVLKLEDPDKDNIYSGTLTVQDPSFNTFEYRYGFVHVADEVTYEKEPSGFSDRAYRVRYIRQTGARQFVQPYSAPVDTWTNAETKTDFETDPYTTDIKDKGMIAETYSLSQNYPNPFNPSTKITFSIPKDGIVTLKVYNVLGQEVATLINQQMKAGTYDVDFNGSKLSSGVYLYSITADNFTSTKKMIMLK